MVDAREEKSLRRAGRSLYEFYESLVQGAAGAILSSEGSLDNTYLGRGEEIVERYGPQIFHTRAVLGALENLADIAAGKTRQALPPVRATSICAPVDEIHEELDEWFIEHPEARPVSVQILGEETVRAVVVYLDHSAGPGGCGISPPE